MNILDTLIWVIQILFIVYFGTSSLYFFIFSMAALFFKETSIKPGKNNYEVTILIPAYKEDNVIIESAQKAVSHMSRYSHLNIIVIADSMKPQTVSHMMNSGAQVLPVTFEKSTKAKSINKALEIISEPCDFIIVLDADNIMAPGFIDNLIPGFEKGFRIVQGHRTAKNDNTKIAALDGISEEINNSIFRAGHQKLGLSSALIGSGFGCEFNLFKDIMKQIDAVGGFDKQLEVLLLKNKIKIGYVKNAIVYDEKTQQPETFVNQRRRWLSAQFVYLKKHFKEALLLLFKEKNIDLFDKVFQFIIPPRIIAIGCTFTLLILNMAAYFILGTGPAKTGFITWLAIAVTLTLAILMALPGSLFNKRLLPSILSIPKGFILTLTALLKTSGANKKFIHTPHGLTTDGPETGQGDTGHGQLDPAHPHLIDNKQNETG